MTRFGFLVVVLPLAACVDETPEPTSSDVTSSLQNDRDQDGLADLIDSCPDIADPTNFDADHDGRGNACDADYDNSGTVTTADFAIFSAALNSQRGDRAYDSRADHDGSGSITTADFAVFTREYGKAVPAAAGVVPFANAQVGDLLTLTTRYPSPIGSSSNTRFITSVTRTASGAIDTIDTGYLRIRVLSPRVWVVENGGVYTDLNGNVAVACPRMTVFSDRPVRGLSQLCSPLAIDGLSITISHQ